MMRGQSKEAQALRLSEGRCPVHGLWMSQIDGWYYPKEGRDFTIVGCSRKDCAIRAKAYGFYGPWELIGDDFATPPLRNPYNDDARTEANAALGTVDKIEGLAMQHGEAGIVQFCGELRAQLQRVVERLDL